MIRRFFAAVPFGLKYFVVFVAVAALLATCSTMTRRKHKELFPITGQCADGTHTRSTGSGACSWHGGVT